MTVLNNVKTITVARVSLVLTVLLLSVSLASLLFQWYLVNGYSAGIAEIIMFSLPFRFNPLGIFYLHNIIYFTNPTLKLQMDFLFLISYTVGFPVTGILTVLMYPLSEVFGFEKFGEAKSRIKSLITHGPKKHKNLIRINVLYIMSIYTIGLLTYILDYTSILLDLPRIGYIFLLTIIGLAGAYANMEGAVRLIKQGGA